LPVDRPCGADPVPTAASTVAEKSAFNGAAPACAAGPYSSSVRTRWIGSDEAKSLILLKAFILVTRRKNTPAAARLPSFSEKSLTHLRFDNILRLQGF
jgi:hypothetical protein